MLRSLILALVAAFALGSSAIAAPPPLPSSGSTPSASTPVDLAAMTLAPSDVSAPGFGLETSDSYLIDSYPERAAELGRDGFLRGYESRLGLAGNGGALATRVQSALDLYASAAGAGRAFGLFASSGRSPVITLTGTHTIGEQSALFAEQETDSNTGKPYVTQTLVFQSGPIGATIYVQYFSDDPNGVAFIESLGDLLLKKVAAGLAGAGPGLGARLARLQLSYDLSTFDGYWRLNGLDLRMWDETPAKLASRLGQYPAATDVYAITQKLSNQPGATVVRWRAAAFATDAGTAAWLDRYPGLYADALGVTLSPVSSTASFGDGSSAFTFQSQKSQGAATRLLLIAARFGSTGVALIVEAPAEIPFDAARALMTAESTCVAGSEPCAYLPVPGALAHLAGG